MNDRAYIDIETDPKFVPPTNDMVIERALELRDYIRDREAAHKKEMLEYENALEALENYLLKVMQDRKETSIKTIRGTAFQSHQMRVGMANREHLIEYTVMSAFNYIERSLRDLVTCREDPPINDDDVRTMIEDAKTKMDFGFWTNHVAKDHVKEYRDEKGVDPPGVEVTTFIACHIRKA